MFETSRTFEYPSNKPTAAVKGYPSRRKDLEKVEGIGPQIAQILIKNGVMDLEDLSQTPVAEPKKFLEIAGRATISLIRLPGPSRPRWGLKGIGKG